MPTESGVGENDAVDSETLGRPAATSASLGWSGVFVDMPKELNQSNRLPVAVEGIEATRVAMQRLGRTILMLEDDDVFSEIVGEILTGYGFNVIRVINGAEGLKKILVQDFDVILCDMVMPGFPGDMFYTAVGRTKPHLQKRFIFMTGHEGNRKIDAFIRRVRGVILLKPLQFHELMARMDLVLSQNPPANPAEAV